MPDRTLLLDAARLARMAYATPDKVNALYAAVKQGNVSAQDDVESAEVLKRVTAQPTYFTDEYTDSQGYGVQYSGEDGPITMLVYRGTSDLADAVADGEIQLVRLKTYLATAPPGVLVHAGFSGQFSTLELQSSDFLSKIYHGIKTSSADFEDGSESQPESSPAESTAGFNLFEDTTVPESAPISSSFFETVLTPLVSSNTGASDAAVNGTPFLNGPPLLVIGHSLGSAVAAIGAFVFSLRFGEGVSYIGFGCPRVGNLAWTKAFNARIESSTRVKNGRDPIDSIIPPVVYQHLESKIHIGRADPFPDIAYLPDICDHDMADYISNLKHDDTSEKPLQWLPYVISFVVNTPVAAYNFIRSLSFYTPF